MSLLLLLPLSRALGGWPCLFWQVCQIELSFREILNNYKKEAQCKPEVFLSIYVGSRNRNGVCTLASILHLYSDSSFFIRVIIIFTMRCLFLWHFCIAPYCIFFLKVISYQQVLVSRHVDIITFYNEVFVPAAKPFLVSLISSGTRPEDKKNANGICCTTFSVWTTIFFSCESTMSSLLLRPNFWITQAISFPKFTRHVPEESFIIS